MKVENRLVSELIPYARNPRTHSDEQIAQIAASIREFGFMNPILIDDKGNVLAGHGRLAAARKLGMKEVPCVLHYHLSDTQRRAYILADNKLALNAGWDDEMLSIEIEELQGAGFDLNILGFDDIDLAVLDIGGAGDGRLSDEHEDPYTRKVQTPTYEPIGEKPRIADLCDDSKTREMIAKIEASDLPDDEKNFLIIAASRHVVFNFEQIANYYAHSNESVQRIMEDSALVIVDFNKAIELGYIHLSKAIADAYVKENGDED